MKGKVWKRHIDQLLENKGNEETSVMDDFEGVSTNNESNPEATEARNEAVEIPMPPVEIGNSMPSAESRYPSRNHHPPIRFDPCSV